MNCTLNKKVAGILAKSCRKKEKTVTNEPLNLVTSVYEDNDFSIYVPGKKSYVTVSKGVH